MDARHKQLLRAVIKQIHPDILSKHPCEQLQNSESLKRLNTHIGHISKGEPVPQQTLWFSTVNNGFINRLEICLPASGSLALLFHAFGLITEEELDTDHHHYTNESGEADVDVLAWLTNTVSGAAKEAEEHQILRSTAQALTAAIENRFRLTLTQESGLTLDKAEQQRHVEALNILQDCLSEACCDRPDMLRGHSVSLCHSESATRDGLESHVTEDGSLFLVAASSTIQQDLLQLDLEEACRRTQISESWVQRVRDLTAALQDMLGVEDVWFWSKDRAASQEFVVWAGRVLEHRDTYEDMMQGRRHAFRVLVHCDSSAPVLDFGSSYGALQVTTDCRPQQLTEYLCGEAAKAASTAAVAQDTARTEEARLLEAARRALGAKHIIRVCSAEEHPSVSRPLKRLIQGAPAIRQMVDLSGIVSIPWNFSMQELKPQLRQLLGPASVQRAASSSSGRSEAAVLGSANRKTPQSAGPGSLMQCMHTQTVSELHGARRRGTEMIQCCHAQHMHSRKQTCRQVAQQTPQWSIQRVCRAKQRHLASHCPHSYQKPPALAYGTRRIVPHSL